MFPYADSKFSYWTGYFTSRANDKEYIRRGSHNLHASSKLYGLEAIDNTVSQQRINDVLNGKNKMLDIMGVSQHHDAVTGTGKQAVANNYAFNMFKGLEYNNVIFSKIISEAAESLAGIQADKPWQWCFKENSTFIDCPIFA